MIGIDRPVERDGYSVGKWVLGSFSPEQRQALEAVGFPAAEAQLRQLIAEPLVEKVEVAAILQAGPADPPQTRDPLAAPQPPAPTDSKDL